MHADSQNPSGLLEMRVMRLLPFFDGERMTGFSEPETGNEAPCWTEAYSKAQDMD